MFSIELLQAISDWQRGGDVEQKARRGKALEAAASNLPSKFRSIKSNCYRQIALDNGSVWNIGTKYRLNETISSWTTRLDFAKQFKGGVPPVGYQGVIFKIEPSDDVEVIVNLNELFLSQEFNDFIEANKNQIDGFHQGIGRYGGSQSEVVISTEYLDLSSLCAWGGYTSSETELANMFFGHKADEEELDQFRNLMVQAGRKCGAYWLTASDAVNRLSERLKRHGDRLSKMKAQQGDS